MLGVGETDYVLALLRECRDMRDRVCVQLYGNYEEEIRLASSEQKDGSKRSSAKNGDEANQVASTEGSDGDRKCNVVDFKVLKKVS